MHCLCIRGMHKLFVCFNFLSLFCYYFIFFKAIRSVLSNDCLMLTTELTIITALCAEALTKLLFYIHVITSSFNLLLLGGFHLLLSFSSSSVMLASCTSSLTSSLNHFFCPLPPLLAVSPSTPFSWCTQHLITRHFQTIIYIQILSFWSSLLPTQVRITKPNESILGPWVAPDASMDVWGCVWRYRQKHYGCACDCMVSLYKKSLWVLKIM